MKKLFQLGKTVVERPGVVLLAQLSSGCFVQDFADVGGRQH